MRLCEEFRLLAQLTERVNLAESRTLYQYAVEEAQEIYPRESELELIALTDLGCAYCLSKDYKSALRTLNAALLIAEELHTNRSNIFDERRFLEEEQRLHYFMALSNDSLNKRNSAMNAYLETVKKSFERIKMKPIDEVTQLRLTQSCAAYCRLANTNADLDALGNIVRQNSRAVLPTYFKDDISAAFHKARKRIKEDLDKAHHI